MEIVKFKKNKDNSYMVIFDNELSLKLYDDVIVKYNLLSNKVLNDKLLKEITEYNDFLNGYYKAIKYIMKKLRSEKEVYTFLEKLDIKSPDINRLIDKLKKDGYINQTNYIKAYINDQVNLTLNGPDKIKNNLTKLGFLEDEINSYLDNFGDIWSERIEKLITKKIKVSKLGKNKLKSKLIIDLVNLGYKKYDIMELLDKINIDDTDSLKKEYSKAYRKYSSKFADEALNNKIKDYLYRKGFDLTSIKEEMRDYE